MIKKSISKILEEELFRDPEEVEEYIGFEDGDIIEEVEEVDLF